MYPGLLTLRPGSFDAFLVYLDIASFPLLSDGNRQFHTEKPKCHLHPVLVARVLLYFTNTFISHTPALPEFVFPSGWMGG